MAGTSPAMTNLGRSSAPLRLRVNLFCFFCRTQNYTIAGSVSFASNPPSALSPNSSVPP
jgi:hypothetical protein